MELELGNRKSFLFSEKLILRPVLQFQTLSFSAGTGTENDLIKISVPKLKFHELQILERVLNPGLDT